MAYSIQPDLKRLDPHDPLPESGSYLLVLRRLAEEEPDGTRLEILRGVGPGLPQEESVVGPDGRILDFEAAIRHAMALAARDGIHSVYAVDRTAGPREQEVLRHRGDHSFAADALDDSDREDGEQGTDLRDRPHDAGYGSRSGR